MSKSATTTNRTHKNIPKKALEYNSPSEYYSAIAVGPPIKWTEEKLMEVADNYINWINSEDLNLFQYQFCKEYNIPHDLFSACEPWMENNPKFATAVRRANEILAEKINFLMLTGKIKEIGSIFTLKAKYGYRDNHYHEQSSPTAVQIVFQVPAAPALQQSPTTTELAATSIKVVQELPSPTTNLKESNSTPVQSLAIPDMETVTPDATEPIIKQEPGVTDDSLELPF